MAKHAKGLVPFSMQPGRVEDFVKGMQEASDARTKVAAESLAVYAGVRAWSAFHRYMKNH